VRINQLQPENIMKLSIATLLSVRDLHPAKPALATVLGDAYSDPEYDLTQSDIDSAAALIDTWYSEITPIGQTTALLDEQTPASYRHECRRSQDAAFALREVIRICGLETPLAWCEPVS